jgi:DNA-binding NarL/FixJ family response regulator
MISVAIVEDNKLTREGLETVVNLSGECCCVCACSTGEDALKLLPVHQPDVVLMDIQLPGMSGIDCVAQLKPLLASARVVMVTVYEDPERIFRAIRAGASGYLLKRATPEQVLSAIRDVQQGGAPMSGEIARKIMAQFRTVPASPIPVQLLSPAESSLLELLEKGFSEKEIAQRLGFSDQAIRAHLKFIYQKLHSHCVAAESRSIPSLAKTTQLGS